MANSQEYAQERMSKRLVKVGKGYYVPVSHAELDGLVGRLMQICDIMGDSVQREAVKSEIKQRTRGWLDDEYSALKYNKFGGEMNPDWIVDTPLRDLSNTTNNEVSA